MDSHITPNLQQLQLLANAYTLNNNLIECYIRQSPIDKN